MVQETEFRIYLFAIIFTVQTYFFFDTSRIVTSVIYKNE
jgi:hypothetical protein